MDDATLEQIKDRVRPIFGEWIEHLRLQAWKFVFVYERSEGRTDDRGGECVMETESDWRYLQARIIIYAGTVKNIEDDELVNIVIHELVHVHLSELSFRTTEANFDDHQERVTTCIARAILQVKENFSGESQDERAEETQDEKVVEHIDAPAGFSMMGIKKRILGLR